MRERILLYCCSFHTKSEFDDDVHDVRAKTDVTRHGPSHGRRVFCNQKKHGVRGRRRILSSRLVREEWEKNHFYVSVHMYICICIHVFVWSGGAMCWCFCWWRGVVCKVLCWRICGSTFLTFSYIYIYIYIYLAVHLFALRFLVVHFFLLCFYCGMFLFVLWRFHCNVALFDALVRICSICFMYFARFGSPPQKIL